MPDDEEVVRVIKDYIGKAIMDLDTYGGKITEELINEIKDIVDVLNKLLVATPIDKDQVEEAIKILRSAQMKIG